MRPFGITILQRLRRSDEVGVTLIREALAACREHLRGLVLFLLYVGCGLREALRLDGLQVDWANRCIRFGRTPTKQPRTVPLTEPVISALASLPHREGEVFRRPDGKPYARKEVAGGEIKTAFRAACRR